MFDISRRRFAKSHEWLDYDTETKQGKLGISKYAADALGDIVHVDLPEQGDSFSSGESIVSTSSSLAINITRSSITGF